MAIENPMDKVRKLLKLAAEGSSASPEEAANAAKTAQRLISKFQLDLSEVLKDDTQTQAQIDLGPMGEQNYWPGKRAAGWENRLGFQLAPAFSCRSYNCLGSGLHVVGKEVNRQAFQATFEYLQDQIAKMSKSSCPEYAHPRSWNNSFGLGAVSTIISQVAIETKQIEAANPGMALVLQTERTFTDQWVEANLKLRSGQGPRITSGSGYESGQAAGRTLNLGSVPGRTRSNFKQLAA